MGLLEGYTFRKQITIAGTAAGIQTNYQMLLDVYRGEGTDSGNSCYLSGRSWNWPHDIRFTKSDGTAELDFWIESSSDAHARIWIEFDSIPASPDTVTFYMYYGNLLAPAASDITNTFLFGDDLEDETIGNDPSKWVVSQGTNSLIKVSGDVAIIKGLSTTIGINFGSLFFAPNGNLWGGHFTDGTVRVSTDGGVTWATKYTFTVGSGIVRGVFVAANGFIYASRDDSGILARSTDGGETWATCLTLSSGDGVVWQMDEDDTGNLYVGEYSSGDGSEECAYIYKSINNGDSWSTIWDNPDNARHIHFVRVDPYTGKIYASQGDAADGKLFRSDNGGETWATIGSGSALWHPTSVIFGDGYRLFGGDNLVNNSTIRKTINDTDFTTVYTPPATDDCVFFIGREQRADGLIVFASWTQTDSERATVIASWDDGATWTVTEEMATGAGNRGYLAVSNFAGDGEVAITRSITSDAVNIFYEKPVKTMKSSSADATQASAYKTVSFPSLCAVDCISWAAQENGTLIPLFVRQDTTDRISVAFWSDRSIRYHNGTDWISSGVYYLKNKANRFTYVINLSAGTWDFYIDDVLVDDDIPFRTAGTTANRIYFASGAAAQGDSYIDSVAVRQLADPEPTWSSWGEQEDLYSGIYLIGNIDLVYGRRDFLLGDINLGLPDWTGRWYLWGDVSLAYKNKHYLLGDFDLTSGDRAYLQGIITLVDRLAKPAAGAVFQRTLSVIHGA